MDSAQVPKREYRLRSRKHREVGERPSTCRECTTEIVHFDGMARRSAGHAQIISQVSVYIVHEEIERVNAGKIRSDLMTDFLARQNLNRLLLVECRSVPYGTKGEGAV